MLIAAASQAELVEADVEEIMRIGAGQRFDTEPLFHARVKAVSTAIAAVAGGTSEVLASLPKGELARVMESEVAAYLAINDYFVSRWQEQAERRRGSGHMDGT